MSSPTKAFLNGSNPYFLDPNFQKDGRNPLKERAEENRIDSFIYTLKQNILLTSSFTSVLSTIASPLRHIPGQIIPFAEKILNVKLIHAFSPAAGLVWSSDLCEMANSIHWMVNGGLWKDYAKSYHCSIAANFALVPTNLLTIVWFCRDFGVASFESLGKTASAIGNVRLFAWAPGAANLMQNWPLVRAIPNLAGHAQSISNVRMFAFVAKLSVGPACMSALCTAYAFFSIQSYQKWTKYTGKLNDAKEEFKTDQSDNVRIKQIHREHKLLAAKWDFFSSATKLILNGTILVGKEMLELPVVTAVSASLPAMAFLGVVVIGCVGYTTYLHASYKKPTINDL